MVRAIVYRSIDTTFFTIMYQPTGVGNIVGVFDLDFEVIDRFRGPRG
ncbi:hypothetical protein [Gimesia maris]|tara:strand:- start:4717 stop:4857 length:141 start_codon:yes stop_codon:yes gene_type:complete